MRQDTASSAFCLQDSLPFDTAKGCQTPATLTSLLCILVHAPEHSRALSKVCLSANAVVALPTNTHEMCLPHCSEQHIATLYQEDAIQCLSRTCCSISMASGLYASAYLQFFKGAPSSSQSESMRLLTKFSDTIQDTLFASSRRSDGT